MRGDAFEVSLEEGPRLYRMIASLAAMLAWPLVRIEAHRLDVAHRTRTGVVVANHRSLLDAAVGLVAFRRLGRYPRVIVASHWFERRVTGPLLRAAGAIPMDRGDPTLHLEAARRVLAAGIPILILPEGRLCGEPGRPTTVGEFKTGAVRLARHCDVGLWALGLVGTDDVWPRGCRRPRLGSRRTRRVVLLGAPELVAPDGEVREATETLQRHVVDLLHEAAELHAAVQKPSASASAVAR